MRLNPYSIIHSFNQYLFIIIFIRFGKPTFFATMTTNPKWREIVDNIFPGQTAADRPDIVSRVFSEKQKVAPISMLFLLIQISLILLYIAS